jgi:hypothetical protein
LVITLEEIDLDLIAAVIGLAITLPVTYLVVDRIVARNEKKRLAPLERTAKERLRAKLGVGSLTTLLITLVIDIRTSLEESKAMSKEVAGLYVTKLKSTQSDLEMILGIYNSVLSVEVAHLTSSIISQIEHLQEDLKFLIEIHPKPATPTHASHIEHLILLTVQLTKKELDMLGESNEQIAGLEKWLIEFGEKHTHPHAEEPIEVSGKHTIV